MQRKSWGGAAPIAMAYIAGAFSYISSAFLPNWPTSISDRCSVSVWNPSTPDCSPAVFQLASSRMRCGGPSDSSPSSVRLNRSEEHTSELQSLMRISYAVFCLKKKKINTHYSKHQ